MKINSKELLLQAKRSNFAVPAANFIDLDSAKSYIKVAEKRGLPLILAYAESHKDTISIAEAALIGNFLAEHCNIPVVLHLDHGMDKDFIFKAIQYGFSSVMIDGSASSFEDNVKITQEVVSVAHKQDVTVEAELGHVGSNASKKFDSIYTEAKDVVNFVNKTGVDSLAVSIGTAHGLYKGTPKINFDRLNEIANATEIPLVLHGGSSSGDKNLNRCATNGISKINIYTDFASSAIDAVKESETSDYLQLKKEINNHMESVLDNYYNVFETKQVGTKGNFK